MKSEKSETTQDEPIPEFVGKYKVQRVIGKGGMGTVYLCWDPYFRRQVAIKCMRPHLRDQKRSTKRFLKEARIAGSMAHPNIIAVYELAEGDPPYYVMPYCQGRSLKQLLANDTTAPAIATALRLFLQICQAMNYAHSKNILHRDLKPDNILIGDFGELVIVDWGLAAVPGEPDPKSVTCEEPGLTLAGKVVGTLQYMAPERIMRQPASTLTEIYALGVILYQMLCLKPPFKRKNYAEARKQLHRERFRDPAKLAPHREVPAQLVRICRRCLHPIPTRRYQSLERLIADVETVLEGRSDWLLSAELNVLHKQDWEFQEHIHIAPLVSWGTASLSEWVGLMISRASFTGNIRLEVQARIKANGNGFGILLNIPEPDERSAPDEGFLAWFSAGNPGCVHLYRCHALVAESCQVPVQLDHWHHFVIEKVDNIVRCSVDGVLVLSYLSHIPIRGSHLGVMHRDQDFDIGAIKVYTGNDSAMVSCLTLPDAFLSYGDYQKALSEYRRVAYSFPERSEGRDARFRAGLTLLEQAKKSLHPAQAQALEAQALQEFERLCNPMGAPLEFLGKAIAAGQRHEVGEEVQYLELALKRYPNHPCRSFIEEHINHRLLEATREPRSAFLLFLLLVMRYLPDWAARPQIESFIKEVSQLIELPLALLDAPDILKMEYALAQFSRLELGWDSWQSRVALLCYGRLNSVSTAADTPETLLLQLLAKEGPPKEAQWHELLKTMPSATWAHEILLKRAQDQGWNLCEWQWDLWTEGLSAVQCRRIWMHVARMALAQNHRSLISHSLAQLTDGAQLHERQLLAAAAGLRAGRPPIWSEDITLPCSAAELAIMSLQGKLKQEAWIRALPVDRYEALRWLRLIYVCEQSFNKVEIIDQLLAIGDWGSGVLDMMHHGAID